MTPKEKQKAIVKAIEKGVPKQRINPENCGKLARKLVRGKNVDDEKIEQMYQNLIEYHNNPDKYKKLNESYRNYMPEVPMRKKIQQIIDAVQSGVAKSHLDPQGNGDAVRKMLKGKRVGDGKVNEVYARLLKLRGKKTTIEPSPPVRKEEGVLGIGELVKKIYEQNKELETLKSQLACLQKQVTQLANENKGQERTKKQKIKVLGISVVEKTDIIRGKKYKRWYGTFRKNGKQHWIYIGVDITKAREKIRNYLERKGEEQCQT